MSVFKNESLIIEDEVIAICFGAQFREYREEYLNIRQSEAAHALHIDPKTLSNYELRKRAVPMELLPKFKEVFNIPDDYFLAMVLCRPLKHVRYKPQMYIDYTKETQTRYVCQLIEQYQEFLERSPELRELLLLLKSLPDSLQERLLHIFKQQLLFCQTVAFQKNHASPPIQEKT